MLYDYSRLKKWGQPPLILMMGIALFSTAIELLVHPV